MSTPSPSTPGISRTCIYVAAGRAIGAREPDSTVRNPDHLVERLLGDPASFDVDHPAVRALNLPYDEAMKDPEVVSAVRMMMIRTRFIDDALERAVAAGVTQVVVLGAGFDTHAYRFEALLANARVFEVDRAATQALKKERVMATLGHVPANLTYVTIDFQHDELEEVLNRHGFDPARKTFFILEGVTMYVPEEGLRRTLQFVGSCPPGSVIVFDFLYRAMVDMIAKIDITTVPEAGRAFVQRFLDLTRDEPWVFGIPMGGEAAFLAEFGLDVREMLSIGGEESLKRYVTKADGTQVGAEALAAVMARMAASGQQMPSPPPERVREQQRMSAYQLVEAVRP